MQARYRSSGDGFRSGSGYRNSQRGRFGSRQQRKQYPSPPPPPAPLRKAEILMEAGRLAAEYLVSKGTLPPNSLDRRWPNGRLQESKGQDREPAVPEGRTSALARLGQPAAADVGYGRRRYEGDDYHHMGSKSQSRGRRRNDPYSRGYGSEWSSRESGRREPWRERGRRYHDTVDEDDEEDDDDFAPGYPPVRRGGFDEAGSSYSRSEATGESGPEVDTHGMADDTGSKASSSSTRRDPLPEADLDENKGMGEAKVIKASNLEVGEEVKSDASGDTKKKNMQEEDMEVQPFAAEGDTEKRHSDLLKFCSFAGVPTKPRSSAAQRSPKTDQGPAGETTNTLEVTPTGASEVTAGEDTRKGSMDNLNANQVSTLECQAPEGSNIIPDQPTVESPHPQLESGGSLPGSGASEQIVDVDEENSFPQHIDKMEEIKIQRDSSPPKVSQENEHSLQDSGDEQLSPYIQKSSTDEEMAEAVDLLKPMDVDAELFPKAGPEFKVKLEKGKQQQLLPTSFNLNLMETPEITEIPDDSVFSDIQTSAPVLQPGNKLLVDVGLSIGNGNGTDNCSQISGDDKMVPVINLEDDSPMEDKSCASPKLKNEIMYSNLDNFLSQTEHVDLDGIQDGYSLGFPDFLGADISGCSSVSTDLNNLQAAMSLHDAEGVPGVDDSIYGSLGEIPISFMEVWDQPPQEYGKFF